jgi:hypothetical protein
MTVLFVCLFCCFFVFFVFFFFVKASSFIARVELISLLRIILGIYTLDVFR